MRVLLVDDEAGIRELVIEVLTREGFKVESTGNGNEALRMFRRRRYDLVITDLLHPGLNGAELIGKIRKLKPWHPVLLFTASPIPTLTKPCDLAELVNAARILTDRRKTKTGKPRRKSRPHSRA
jgi:two-component system response regulator (stage 0 sporulation protein F)